MPRGGLQTSLVSMVNMLAASCNGPIKPRDGKNTAQR